MPALAGEIRRSVRAPGARPSDGELDDFAAARIHGPEDITSVFRDQYFFGCEADDATTPFVVTFATPPTATDWVSGWVMITGGTPNFQFNVILPLAPLTPSTATR